MREVASSILVLPHFFLFFSFFFSFFLAHSPLAPGVDQPDRDGHRWGGHQGGSAAAAEKKKEKKRRDGHKGDGPKGDAPPKKKAKRDAPRTDWL